MHEHCVLLLCEGWGVGESDGEGVAACGVGEDRGEGGGGGGGGWRRVQGRVSLPVPERVLVMLLRMRGR